MKGRKPSYRHNAPHRPVQVKRLLDIRMAAAARECAYTEVMTDSVRTRMGGWVVALGGVGVVVGAVFFVSGDLDWRLGVSFGAGVALVCLGAAVMGSASEGHRRRLLSRWGYVAGLAQGGWDPERSAKSRSPRS